ncbi:hypothetical protein NDU88_004137 [Pleurodeles waltl]|uniref:Uncharacterized protein n=1 Tax=Pleurodeles waltl TaxID=8319 RepID=A0AAV7VFB8_PLEWA|nr:hypothetical protein NDU88_004137 [Pleurodeles waltl]
MALSSICLVPVPTLSAGAQSRHHRPLGLPWASVSSRCSPPGRRLQRAILAHTWGWGKESEPGVHRSTSRSPPGPLSGCSRAHSVYRSRAIPGPATSSAAPANSEATANPREAQGPRRRRDLLPDPGPQCGPRLMATRARTPPFQLATDHGKISDWSQQRPGPRRAASGPALHCRQLPVPSSGRSHRHVSESGRHRPSPSPHRPIFLPWAAALATGCRPLGRSTTPSPHRWTR